MGDLQPVSYAADYDDDQGKAMVEYRTYILGKTTIYWFVFRAEKGDFEASQPMFGALVASFKMPESDRPGAGGPKTVSEADKLESERLCVEGERCRLEAKEAVEKTRPWPDGNLCKKAEQAFCASIEKNPANYQAWAELGSTLLMQQLLQN